MIRKVQIDFSGKLQPARQWLWLATGLGVVVMVAAGTIYLRERFELSALERQLTSLQRPSVPLRASDTRAADATARVQRDLQLSWNSVFQAIEEADHKDIALLALRPDPQKQQVSIVGEARSTEAMFSYLEQLEDHGLLRDPYISSYQLMTQQQGQPVRFEVRASWLVVTP